MATDLSLTSSRKGFNARNSLAEATGILTLSSIVPLLPSNSSSQQTHLRASQVPIPSRLFKICRRQQPKSCQRINEAPNRHRSSIWAIPATSRKGCQPGQLQDWRQQRSRCNRIQLPNFCTGLRLNRRRAINYIVTRPGEFLSPGG